MSELEYQYSFRVPNLPGVNFRQGTFNLSRGIPAFRPETASGIRGGTLLLCGHPSFPSEFAELTIPTIDNTAATLRGWCDPSAGLIKQYSVPPSQGYVLRGLVINPDDTYAACLTEFYNVAQVDRCPFFRGDLSLGGYSGLWNGGYHSLQLGGYLSPLSPELRRHFKRRWASGETIPQGSGKSNRGPSLYVFDLPEKSFPANSAFQSSPVITFINGASYPGYYPSWKINSLHCLPDAVIWVGRKGIGQEWYGGQNKTLADGSIAMRPDGTAVRDAVYPDKGYHSEGYIPCVWYASNASIIAGVPEWRELALPNMTPLKGSELTSTYDEAGRRLFIVDPKSDADRPVVRVFAVR